MLLCIKLTNPNDAAAIKFLDSFKVRLVQPFDIFKFPFTGWLYHNNNLIVFNLDIGFPPFWLVGFVGFIVCASFNLNWLAWLLSGLIASVGLFWIPYLYLILFRIGLRKAGYKGKVSYVSKANMLRWSFWDK
jgi:hypothetical protein